MTTVKSWKRLPVYRVWGGSSPQWGTYWTPVNPLGMANARSELGLPDSNLGDHLTVAYALVPPDLVGIAAPGDGGPGGAPEFRYFTSKLQLEEFVTIDANF